MENEILKNRIIDEIKTVFDPEIPINVWDLGLIYELKVENDKVEVVMTLTAPNCPEAMNIPRAVLDKIKAIPEVAEATIDITFDPPWDMSRVSEDAKLLFDML